MKRILELSRDFHRSEFANTRCWVKQEFADQLSLDILAAHLNCDGEIFGASLGMTSKEGQGDEVSPLPGRARVYRLRRSNGNDLVVRVLFRGGWAKHVSAGHYLKFAKGDFAYRPFKELCILEFLRKNGVKVPNPAAALVRGPGSTLGGLLYKGLIATEEIPEAANLLMMLGDKRSDSELESVSLLAGKEAAIMLKAGVYHPDLHLGNVLYAGGEAYLIDFDKAELMFSSRKIGLAPKRMKERWYRSVRKHSERCSQAALCGEAFERGMEIVLGERGE